VAYPVAKWLTLSPFAYVGVVFAVHVPWRTALLGTFIPYIALDAEHAMGLIAVLGTTISPYLFFWQSALVKLVISIRTRVSCL
jgi:Mn2+/Fe2+ NRAMP family transporter